MADVQKSAFSLSSATLMIAPAFSVDPFSLTPALHSVGMVSEVAVSIDSSITELLNGVQQVTVDAKRTGVSASVTANVYEMTAQNLMRSQALSGTALPPKRGTLTASAASAAVSLSITSNPIPGEATSGITALTDIPAGSWLLLQQVGATNDYVFPTKSSGAATGSSPYVVPIADPYSIPTGMSFPAGSTVWIVQPVAVGDRDADQLYGVKITGVLSNYDRPLTVVFPKVRMIKGFQLSFNETQYSSMPWEMKPLLMSAGEAASFSRGVDIGTRAPGIAFPGG